MSTELNTRIKLRKDTLANWNRVGDSLVPLNGECCIVDAGEKGIRLKVGDGVRTFNEIEFVDQDSSFKYPVVIGYYLNGHFYKDSAYVVEYPLYTHQLYVDFLTKKIYFYDGTALQITQIDIPLASASAPGIMKLYTTSGNNADGTITQKLFTDSIDTIEFGQALDDEECLVLNKP